MALTRSALGPLFLLTLLFACPAVAAPDLMQSGFVMGVNYAGLDSWFGGDGHAPGINYAVPVESDFDYLASRGIRLLRVPFRWEHLCPAGPDGPLDPTYLAQLRRVTDWAHARGMGIVLDLHNYGSYRGAGYDGKADIGRPGAPTITQFATTWGRLATASKDWPGLIGYDTMNEPIHVPDLASMQQAAVDAIRAAGATQPVALEGNHYSTAGTWVTDGNEALYAVTDRLDRLIIEAHVYPDCDSSGTHSRWSAQSTDPARDDEGGTHCATNQAVTVRTGADRATVFLRSALTHHKRIWLGEVGAASDPPWRLAIDAIVGAVRDAGGIVTYWAAGAGYGDYPFSVMPQPPGRQPGDVIDTPMMANVTKYTGFTAHPYGLIGPRIGAPGAVAGPFTLIMRGALARPVRITPGDGDAGGRFDPASVVVPAGFNGSPDGMAPAALHFTYRPPTTPGVITLRLRNDSGLLDPPLRLFSTLSDPLARSGMEPIAIFSPSVIDPSRAGPTVQRTPDGKGVTAVFNIARPPDALRPPPASHWYPAAAAPTLLPAASGWRMDRSRLEAPVALASLRAACVMVAGTPAGPGSLVAWVSPAGDTLWRFPGGTGSWDLRLDGGPTLTLGPPPDRIHPHVYAMCFDAGDATLFVDGTVIAHGRVGTQVLPEYRSRDGRGFPPTMAVGFDPSYNDTTGIGYAKGDLIGIIITSGRWSEHAVTMLSEAYRSGSSPAMPQ